MHDLRKRDGRSDVPSIIQTRGASFEVVTCDVPAVRIVLDQQACRSHAAALGVHVNTLLAALAARLGFRLGRVDADGRVKLVMPVSDRTPGDLRNNAAPATVL